MVPGKLNWMFYTSELTACFFNACAALPIYVPLLTRLSDIWLMGLSTLSVSLETGSVAHSIKFVRLKARSQQTTILIGVSPQRTIGVSAKDSIIEDSNAGSGQAYVINCTYSTLCRQVVIDDEGRVAEFDFETNSGKVKWEIEIMLLYFFWLMHSIGKVALGSNS